MKKIEGLNINDGVIVLDDVYLVDCTFTNCKIVYSGEVCGWVNTAFINCSHEWHGAAARGISTFLALGHQLQPTGKFPLMNSPAATAVSLEYNKDGFLSH